MTVADKKSVHPDSRRRSAVLGAVEERMRALIERGVRPTVSALKAELGPIGVVAIRRAKAELVAGGLVRVPAGLGSGERAEAPPTASASAVDALRATAERLDAAFEAPRPRPRPRRVGPFRRDVREALRRERAFLAWSLAKKGGAS